MSLATELLDDITWFDEPIQINADKSLIVPNSTKHIAVQYDHDVNTVRFELARVWGEIDLSTMDIYVNCVLPNGKTIPFRCTNVTFDDDLVKFDWVITEDVTWLHGSIIVLVCAKAADDDGTVTNRWHSKPNNELYISEGIACAGLDVDRKLDTPEIRLEVVVSTTAVLGRAILGHMILGKTTDEPLPKLAKPYVWLESAEVLDAPEIYLSNGEKLNTPEIWLDITAMEKLDAPTIELLTDKLEAPVIELANV
jgi:hypothetical protein